MKQDSQNAALKRAKLFYNLKIPATYYLAGVALFTLFRILFTALYADRLTEASLEQIAMAFLVGLRFDASTMAILMAPFLFLSLFNVFNRFAIFRGLWNLAPIPLFLWMTALWSANLIYYENAGKHLGYESFAYLDGDFKLLLGSALSENTLTVLAGFAGMALLAVLGGLLVKKVKPAPYAPLGWGRGTLNFVLVIILVMVGIRGGLQREPLRANDAIVSNTSFLNNLGLNPVYTTLMDLKSYSVPREQRMPLEHSVCVVRNEIDFSGAEFVSDKYPLLRRCIPKNGPTRKAPNIVVVMLENWTGKFINPISSGVVNGQEVTPNFNKLAREGVFFKRFYSPGGRTTNAMMATLAGIPDKPGLTVVRTHEVLGNFSGMGNIMKSLDYDTFFVTGGPLDFDNKNTVLKHLGFDTLIGQKKIKQLERYETGSWGCYDEDVLEVLHENLEKRESKNPFLAVLLTLTTHYPYRVPHKKFETFDKKSGNPGYLNVLKYADHSIGKFMAKARKSSYFENTVFIFMGDHTHHRHLSYREDKNVPFLVYAPGLLKPAVKKDIASQLDVIPTILGLVNRETYFSAMGRNLFAKRKKNSAYFAFGNLFGWIEGDLFYHQVTDATYGTMPRVHSTKFEIPRCDESRSDCNDYQLKARAFLNMSSKLLETNRIFPPEKQLLPGKSSIRPPFCPPRKAPRTKKTAGIY